MNLQCKEKILLPGQCCPICNVPSSNTNNSCHFDKLKYAPGSKWHPFLSPNGFDLCTTCSCRPNLDVVCERKKCPLVVCPEEDRELDEGGCCSRCNQRVSSGGQTKFRNSYIQNDMSFVGLVEQQKLEEEQKLREGGCKIKGHIYLNGTEWIPTVGSLGEKKCIVCKCTNGARNCSPTKCEPLLDCKKIVMNRSECCPICVDNLTNSSRNNVKIYNN